MVRLLTPADLADYRAVRLRALRTCPDTFSPLPEEEMLRSDDDVAAMLGPRPSGSVLGAFADASLGSNGLVGIARVERETLHRLRHTAHIYGLYVAPEARGHALGEALLRAAEAYAVETWGVARIALDVIDSNTPALGLYERLGYVAYGLEPDYMRVADRSFDRRLMAKALAASS